MKRQSSELRGRRADFPISRFSVSGFSVSAFDLGALARRLCREMAMKIEMDGAAGSDGRLAPRLQPAA
jgi:hypothetical protein